MDLFSRSLASTLHTPAILPAFWDTPGDLSFNRHIPYSPTNPQALADSVSALALHSPHNDENTKLLFNKRDGNLKTKAPNAFMLFRLSVIKSLKGTKMSANEINMAISRRWNSFSESHKNSYKALSRKMQNKLDLMNRRVTRRAKSIDKVQIVVPNVFCSSVDTHIFSSQAPEYTEENVAVLWASALILDPSSIISFQPDKSGNGILYPNQLQVPYTNLNQ